MWNNCYRVSESTNIDFSSAVAKFKKILKFALLSTQKLYENNIIVNVNLTLKYNKH